MLIQENDTLPGSRIIVKKSQLTNLVACCPMARVCVPMSYLLFLLCITVVHGQRWECDPDTESCPEWNEFGGE